MSTFKNKNSLRTIEAEISGSYKKACIFIRHFLDKILFFFHVIIHFTTFLTKLSIVSVAQRSG